MNPQVMAAINYFKSCTKMNPRDPSALQKLQEMFSKAKQYKMSPNFAKYPQELRAAIEDAFQNLSAMPQLSGVKMQVQGNKWDAKFPVKAGLAILRRNK